MVRTSVLLEGTRLSVGRGLRIMYMKLYLNFSDKAAASIVRSPSTKFSSANNTVNSFYVFRYNVTFGHIAHTIIYVDVITSFKRRFCVRRGAGYLVGFSSKRFHFRARVRYCSVICWLRKSKSISGGRRR